VRRSHCFFHYHAEGAETTLDGRAAAPGCAAIARYAVEVRNLRR
jgi:hypothetical protein